MDNTPLYDTEDLLLRIAKGDESAFATLYLHFYDKIYSIGLMYLKVHEIAEDATQQIFLKLWEKRVAFAGIKQVEAFLFVTARNEIFNMLRRRSTQENFRSFIQELFLQEANTPEELLILKQRAGILEGIIQTLPARQQEAFRLSREKGLRYEAIAREMNISVATVKEHISKALEHIRRLLMENKDEFLLLALGYFMRK